VGLHDQGSSDSTSLSISGRVLARRAESLWRDWRRDEILTQLPSCVEAIWIYPGILQYTTGRGRDQQGRLSIEARAYRICHVSLQSNQRSVFDPSRSGHPEESATQRENHMWLRDHQ